MISIYSTIEKNIQLSNLNFIDNFCSLADEVVISSQHESIINTLNSFVKKDNFKAIKYTKDINNNICYVSDLLNFALEETTMPVKVCLNMFEQIPINQKVIWHDMAKILLTDNVPSYAIPLISIKNNEYTYVKSKWYMHKSGIMRGSPVIDDGSIDTTDCLTLIDDSKHLVPFRSLPTQSTELKNGRLPFVVQNAKINI